MSSKLILSGIGGISTLVLMYRAEMILEFIRDCCLASRLVETFDLVVKIDDFIKTNCHSSSFGFGSYIPSTGFHLYLGEGVVIFYKYTVMTSEGEKSRYRIYSMYAKHLDEIYDKIITTNNGEVCVYRLIHLSSWQHILNHSLVKIPTNLRIYQTNIIIQILTNFKKGDSNTILICRDSGKGKSTIPRLLAKEYNKSSMLVEGFHPTSPGVSFAYHILSKRINNDTLLILLIDDIELAFEKANTGEQGNEVTCHSYNKAEICSLLQQFKDTSDLIVICTTTTPLIKMEENYSEYLRIGRFDIKCQF